MKAICKNIFSLTLLFLIIFSSLAIQGRELVIPLFGGSEIRNDYLVGYEEVPLIVDDETIIIKEGYPRRIFCQAPENRSALEIIRNYERAFRDKGGEVIFSTRKPQDIKIEGMRFKNIFQETRRNPGSSNYTEYSFPDNITEYTLGKLIDSDKEIYIMVAAGTGSWHVDEEHTIFYELVILEVGEMETGMLTEDIIAKAIEKQGKIAVYDLLFDTGEAKIKAESAPTLATIATYLNANKDIKVLVVGHTDNVGDFNFNLDLSKKRANSVITALVEDYNVNREQMEAFGAGSIAPITSNGTESGRAQNRRVEIVEQ